MDKNTITGIVLSALFVIAYFFITKPSPEEIAKQQRYLDSIQEVEYRQKEFVRQEKETRIELEERIESSDSLNPEKANALTASYGRYAEAATGTENLVNIDNELISVTLSNKGARPYEVRLKNYKTHNQQDLILLSRDSSKFGLRLSEIGKSTDELFFELTEQKILPDSTKIVTYRLKASNYAYLEFAYSLQPNSYSIDLQINSVGMEQYIRESRLNLYWENYMYGFEKSKEVEQKATTIVWKYYEDDVEEINPQTNDIKKEPLNGKVKWVGFKHQYFSAILIAQNAFERGGEIISEPLDKSEDALKLFSADLYIPKSESNAFQFYFGPNHYPTLKKYGNGVEDVLKMGWFGFITKYAIIPIFSFLSNMFTSYGLIILLLTIILKLVLFPLTFKSYLSTARMRVLKPQIDVINEKFPNQGDAAKRQQATMELYNKAGVNPMGGCLPMLIQFPILIAMFRFFPASIELRQQSFLWASDLSSYDSILDLPFNIPFYGDHVSLFTLLMAVSMILINQMNMSNTPTTPGMPNMKVMMWIMSIMMIFWFNSYSSGLSYYYFLANVITLLQTYIIRQVIDDKKILLQLEANKKKPKKKSSFQARLEKMAREQQKLRK